MSTKVLIADENKGFGGAERHVLSLARAFNSQGALDSVACRKNSWLAQNGGDLPLYSVGFRNEVDMLSVYSLFRRMKSHQPKVIHCIGHRDLVACALARNLPGAPPTVLVKAEHSYPDQNLSPLFLWAYNQCHAIVSVGRSLATHVKQAIKPKKELRMEVIPNGIEFPRQTSTPPSADGRPLRIGVLSPLRPGKGHSDFLKAVARLTSQLPDQSFEFKIAGDGELLQTLQQEAEELHLKVEFLGHVPEPMDFLESLDLSVIPSHRETFSLVTLESLAAGRPVIAAASEGVSELCQGRAAATLYPVGDVTALSDVLADFCAKLSHYQALAFTDASSVKTDFSAKVMADRYLTLYADLLG